VFLATLFGAFVVVSLDTGASEAANKADRKQAADELVREALHREIYGANDERSRLLDAARRQLPEHAPAMWHTGHVRLGNAWVNIDHVPQRATSDPRLVEYRHRRLRYTDLPEDHYAMANWCRQTKLHDRERAHLMRVIDQMPNHAEVRRRLGFCLIDGRWYSIAQIQEQIREAEAAKDSFGRWAKQLKAIARGFDGSPLMQRTAAERLLAVRDPQAVPAIEAVLASRSEIAALHCVPALEKMRSHTADLCLAKLAVFSTWESVRTAAAGALKRRPLENFVPDLLAAMHGPVRSAWQIYESRGRRLMFRHVLRREGQDSYQQLVLETGYRRISLPGGDRAETMSRGLLNAKITSWAREVAVRQHNATSGQLNDRITNLLVAVTNQDLVPQPQAWWQWWDEYNARYRSGYKPIDSRYSYDEVDIFDRVSLDTNANSEESPEDEESEDDDVANEQVSDTNPFMNPNGGVGPYYSGVMGGTHSPFSHYTNPAPVYPIPVVEPNPFGINSLPTAGLWQYHYPLSCLAAGTKVWTESGPKVIEEIQVGDLVLSQDPETGRLAYKPVLRATTRPAARLIKLNMANESLTVTQGHFLWVSGEGWVRARDLKGGMELHGPSGTVQLSTTEDAEFEQTYNLVVAEFHTYFVGERSPVLSQDNTSPQKTDAVVPGLVER
jgi:hypothetical protein